MSPPVRAFLPCLLGALLAGVLLGGAAEPGQEPPARPHPWPPYLGTDGMPTRPLSDEELWRALLLHSATNQAVTDRIVACSPFGRPGWRRCTDTR